MLATSSFKNPSLFVFGCGYTAQYLSLELISQGWTVFGTTRHKESFISLKEKNICPLLWDGKFESFPALIPFLKQSSYCLISIPPSPMSNLPSLLSSIENLKLSHLLYFSSTNVYGDFQGNWVTEDASCMPGSEEGKLRLQEEKEWKKFHLSTATPLTILRLGAIYGPNRNTLQTIIEKSPPPITKQGHFFNRVHVQDISRIIRKIFEKPLFHSNTLYNAVDTHPASYADVLSFGYQLLKKIPPSPVCFETSSPLISPVFKKYFIENKRICSSKIQRELDFSFLYPSYKEGFKALAKEL